jgi:hypothetical protein
MHPTSTVGRHQVTAPPGLVPRPQASLVMLRRVVVSTASCARVAVVHRALMPATALGNSFRFYKTVKATIAVSSKPPGGPRGARSSPPGAAVHARVRRLLSEMARKVPNHPSALEELTRAFDIMQHHVVNGQVTKEGMAVAHKELGELAAMCMGSPELVKAYIEAREMMRQEAAKVRRPVYTIFDRTFHAYRKVDREAVIDWNVAVSKGDHRRIRLLGNPAVLEQMQERHVVLEAPNRTLPQIIVPSEIDVKERTLVLHGESGCGKTIAALSRAAGEGRACVYLVMNDRIDSEFGLTKQTKLSPETTPRSSLSSPNLSASSNAPTSTTRLVRCLSPGEWEAGPWSSSSTSSAVTTTTVSSYAP